MDSTFLDNGIQVLSERIPGVRSASVGVWVRQGSAHERDAEAGASHLLEHMVFKGTARRTAQEIALSLESLGGSLDAYTTREHTSYQARVLDRFLPQAVDVLADLVLAPLLRTDDLALEREVVLEEIAQVEDTPDDLVFDLHADHFWGGHPYGRPILGSAESVAGMSAATLRDIHSTRYTGRGLVVAAAGNVEHDEFVGRVAEFFGSVDAGAGPPEVSSSPEARVGEVRVPRDTAQAHLVFGGMGPSHADPERYALILLDSALGGGMSSRLFQKVREEMGLCYSIFTFHSFYRSGGVAGVYVGTRPASAGRAADAVRSELERVVREGLPADELAQIKQQVMGQVMLSLESTASRLYRLASFALHGEELMGLDEFLARIDSVREEDILLVASRYMDPAAQLLLRLGPDGDA